MNWLLLALIVPLLIIGFVLWGVAQVLIIDRRTYARFWQRKRAEPVAPNAIHLVALGDSTFQGLGASRPMNGTVGRVARYLEEKTGRPVHIENFSVTGAKAIDVAMHQLPSIDVRAADVIIVAVGANDALKVRDINVFERSIDEIVQALPADRTIMADVAMVRDRDAYQTVLERLREKAKLRRGDIEAAFKAPVGSGRQIARDFFHPSDYGYEIWFEGFRLALDKLISDRSLAK